MKNGDPQTLITQIVSNVLDVQPDIEKSFDWLKNIHFECHFKNKYSLIDRIFTELGGNINSGKQTQSIRCDAYFNGEFNFIFEFDEIQHFSTARLETLDLYPDDIQVGFDVEEYKGLCKQQHINAERHFSHKKPKDFNFKGGRIAQRAYFDCFRDILPTLHGLNPTVRISEFEVCGISVNNSMSRDVIRQLLKRKGVL